MNVDQEVADYKAAGALAEEIPYWGWLEDGRTCLTRSGELVSIARLSPAVLDGRTPEQMDGVLERWQRMLSGADSRTRIYFYLFRRASSIRGRRAGRAIHRRRHLAAAAAGFPEQARANHPDLYCLDSRSASFIRLQGPVESSLVAVLPAELAGPETEPA